MHAKRPGDSWHVSLFVFHLTFAISKRAATWCNSQVPLEIKLFSPVQQPPTTKVLSLEVMKLALFAEKGLAKTKPRCRCLSTVVCQFDRGWPHTGCTVEKKKPRHPNGKVQGVCLSSPLVGLKLKYLKPQGGFYHRRFLKKNPSDFSENRETLWMSIGKCPCLHRLQEERIEKCTLHCHLTQ